MRYYGFNFGMICPKNTTEETLDKFEDEFVKLIEKYDFSVGDGLIEVDENGNKL